MMPRLFPLSNNNNGSDEPPTVLATIFLGSNDASTRDSPLYVPLEEYKENLQEIVGYLRAVFPRIKLILITPSVVDNERWPTRTTEGFIQYADVVRELGAELSIPIADLGEEGPCRITLDDLVDGLHMASSGNRKIYQAIRQAIISNYPELVPGDVHEAPLTLTTAVPAKEAGATTTDAPSTGTGTAGGVQQVPGSLPKKLLDTNPGMPLHYPDRQELGGKSEKESKEYLDSWTWSSKL